MAEEAIMHYHSTRIIHCGRSDASFAEDGVEVCCNIGTEAFCSEFEFAPAVAAGAVVAVSGFAVTAVIAANCGIGVPSFTTLKAKG